MYNIRVKSKDIEFIEFKFKDDFKDTLIPTETRVNDSNVKYHIK